MSVFEYRDKEAVLVKLIDTNELFMDVNQKIILEKQYATSSQFQKATQVMKKASDCFRTMKV